MARPWEANGQNIYTFRQSPGLVTGMLTPGTLTNSFTACSKSHSKQNLNSWLHDLEHYALAVKSFLGASIELFGELRLPALWIDTSAPSG